MRMQNGGTAELDASRQCPLVSVVIPAYNDSATLAEAIESVLAQSYKNFEIIVINDGSCDDGATEKILKTYADRCRCVTTANNGVSSARNKGVGLARGKYVAFLDADDLFSPDKLEKQVGYMEKNGLFASHTSYNRLDLESNTSEFLSTAVLQGKIFPRIIGGCTIATPTVMLRTEVLKDVGFKKEIGLGEDICLWIDIAYRYDFGQIDLPLSTIRTEGSCAAYNPASLCAGVANILQYVCSKPEYAAETEEVSRLCYLLLHILNQGEKGADDAGEPEKPTKYLSWSWRITKPIRAFGEACSLDARFGRRLSFFFKYLMRKEPMRSDSDIEESVCWRVTAPLRAVHSFLFNRHRKGTL